MIDRVTHLEKFASSNVRARGVNYFVQRRVSIVSIEDDIRAHVLGSRRYTVVISPRANELQVACSCEHFERDFVVCKHIWATLLSIAERDASLLDAIQRLVPDGDLDVDEENDDTLDEDGFESARSNIVSFRPRPSWKTFFQTLQSRIRYEMPSPASAEVPAEILYAIDVARYSRGGVVIDTYARFAKKNGEPGAPRKARLSDAIIARLPETDRELVSLLSSPYEAVTLDRPKLRVLLPRLAATNRLFLLGAKNVMRGPLRFDERLWEFRVVVERREKGFVIAGRFVIDDQQIDVGNVDLILSSQWFVAADRIARFDGAESDVWLEALRTHGEVSVPASAEGELAASLAASPRTRLTAPVELQILEVEPQAKLILMREHGDLWHADFRIVYGGEEIEPSRWKASKQGSQYIRRRPDLEKEFSDSLMPLGFRGYGGEFHIADRQLLRAVSQLLADDWQIEMSGEPLMSGGELELEISSGVDWFDLAGGVSFGDHFVGLPQLLESIRKEESFVRVDGGGFAAIDPQWMERLEGLATAERQGDGALRFKRSQVTLVDALFASQAHVTVDRDFDLLRKSLQRAEGVAPRHEPPGFGTELRPYQRDGLGWLHFLRDVRFGGCLADDMGLGKTVQALALLEELRQEGAGRPSLVIAPRSLMFNWKAEAARFAPELRVLDHHGIDRLKGSDHFSDYDLILTTYATLQRDLPHLAAVDLEYVILDEAQAIKNATSQSAKAVKTLRPRHRLALSGTPIENHLGELWSLFDFLNPGMLGTARTFSRSFGLKGVSLEQREKLARIVRPFLLRRTKETVALDLPEKDEQTLWVELSEEERRNYDELREHYRALLLQRVGRDGIAKSKIYILEALLRLRQAAIHPALLDLQRKDQASAKFEALEAELSILSQSDHKALVFSQFTSLLDLLEPRLEKLKIGYVRLDGRSRNREELVQLFQNEKNVQVFLISLKAGGVGLNLTAADYVYLLDPWWNPAVESQAIDRAHRIGQQRRVTATRIVASDTVEEKILELQRHKKALADSIIKADDAVLRTLDLADLEMLLS